MSAVKTCMVDDCERPKRKGKHKCEFHWLLGQSPDIQIEAAKARTRGADKVAEIRARVSKKLWPEGERWCAGCQAFVPLFYCTGSQCKAHAAMKSHAYRLEKIYGISSEDYDALMEYQGGVCYICGRKSNTKRLAVDHDHDTGRVRGLLCPDNERGCNHAIVGNIRDIAMARRIVEYLENPPYDRLKGVSNAGSGASEESAPPGNVPGVRSTGVDDGEVRVPDQDRGGRRGARVRRVNPSWFDDPAWSFE